MLDGRHIVPSRKITNGSVTKVSTNDPKHLRDRAEEARAIAEDITDARTSVSTRPARITNSHP
jgi:hypothetical protein